MSEKTLKILAGFIFLISTVLFFIAVSQGFAFLALLCIMGVLYGLFIFIKFLGGMPEKAPNAYELALKKQLEKKEALKKQLAKKETLKKKKTFRIIK